MGNSLPWVPGGSWSEPDDQEDTYDDLRPSSDWLSGRRLSRPHTVAVAEDDGDMRSLLVAELRRDGYEVCELKDGHALMEYLRALMDPEVGEEPPDLIVTDIRMPGCSGMDILDFLHQLQWDIPVILITAFGDRPTHTEAQALGAVRVLDKPFQLTELKASIYAAVVDRDAGSV